jgi:hypothetical protein
MADKNQKYLQLINYFKKIKEEKNNKKRINYCQKTRV